MSSHGRSHQQSGLSVACHDTCLHQSLVWVLEPHPCPNFSCWVVFSFHGHDKIFNISEPRLHKTYLLCRAVVRIKYGKIPHCLAQSRCAIDVNLLSCRFYVYSRKMTSSLGKNGCYSLCGWNNDNMGLWETLAFPAGHRKWNISLPARPCPLILITEASLAKVK